MTSKYCCHISSDGKSLRDFGKCDKDNNYLWIKSDPTFEGLKQIIYEPEHRIFIGPQKPGEKKSYFTIDKVRFLDNSGDLQFSSEPIEINQNLTTIIGGKSTGKSLLLHYIAKTIDPEEVRNRTSANGGQISYDFDSSVDFNFEVLWKDSQRSLLKTQQEVAGSESKQRKILYIPQKYLNVLSETDIKSREALNKFVLAVILQDQTFNEKYQETMLEIKETVKSIPDGINELFLVQDDINNIEEELKRIGDQKGIISYIQSLQKEADTIKVKSGLSDKQIKQYEDLGTREKI